MNSSTANDGYVEVSRTFTEWREAQHQAEGIDWVSLASPPRGSVTWSELNEKRLCVILGEAGVGKTAEFRERALRINASGKRAFLVPLNLLSDSESWRLSLGGDERRFDEWLRSDETAYFFLDAVDEARLSSHSHFEMALQVVRSVLSMALTRVHILISSRITDWASEPVRGAVKRVLVEPIQSAFRLATAEPRLLSEPGETAREISASDSAPEIEPFVVRLNPLSGTDARKCARAFGLDDEATFWAAVSKEGYEFSASRPLDLRWMVQMWTANGSLGKPLDFVSESINFRLKEFNENYVKSGPQVAHDKLRSGAMRLAAALEFAGLQSFKLGGWFSECLAAQPHEILGDWPPQEVNLLLASALFDPATYGQIKFHHRSMREYLAAVWVAERLDSGVPWHRLVALFAASPFGSLSLIPARRPALAWLAAMEPKVREWVVAFAPEILVFEGDPTSWDLMSADEAFCRFIHDSRRRTALGWVLSESEFARVGRALTPGLLASLLLGPELHPRARNFCFQIVSHAKLSECSAVIFQIFRDPSVSGWEREHALYSLAHIATQEQRDALREDLRSGNLHSDELVAGALAIIDWTELSVDELARLFRSAKDRTPYGGGAIAHLVRDELLPTADFKGAILLVRALLASMPTPSLGSRFWRTFASDDMPGAWMLSILPNGLQRVLKVLSTEHAAESGAVLVEAAELIEAMRDLSYSNPQELAGLKEAVARHSQLRWTVALAIAQSEDIRSSMTRLTWHGSCLVIFDVNDLPELIQRANDAFAPPEEAEIWFAIAEEIALRELRGRNRAKALRVLIAGQPRSRVRRRQIVSASFVGLRSAAMQRRGFRRVSLLDRAERANRQAKNRKIIEETIDTLANGTNFGALQQLVAFSYNVTRPDHYSKVAFDVIQEAYGSQVAIALKSGLNAYWLTSVPPNPSDFASGKVPLSAIVALAGLQLRFSDQHVAALSKEEAAKAAQLAVWELNGPPEWFLQFWRSYREDARAALAPWISEEALQERDENRARGALEFALNCTPEVRKGLLAHLVEVVKQEAIVPQERYRAVFEALAEDGLLLPQEVAELCHRKLSRLERAHTLPKGGAFWIRKWIEVDAEGAWRWCRTRLKKSRADSNASLLALAEALGDLSWVKTPLTQVTADVLVELHERLGTYDESRSEAEENGDDFMGPPARRLRSAIPNVLARVTGSISHRALVALLQQYSDITEYAWVEGLIAEQAALEAAQTSCWTAEQLSAIEERYSSSPVTEAQLFDQVLARLEEIKLGVEEGPFSERCLFSSDTPEKYLQVWLAAKFLDASRRAYTVHREEEVDTNKRTDIQVSCGAHNVCIEIKPLDRRSRGYTAASLGETLRTQIVGQYLRGYNSSRGILVLMLLEDKKWDIPGGQRRGSFSELVGYLKAEAGRIRDASPGLIMSLSVGAHPKLPSRAR